MRSLQSARGQTTTEFVMISGLTVVIATGMGLVMSPTVRATLQVATECVISDVCGTTADHGEAAPPSFPGTDGSRVGDRADPTGGIGHDGRPTPSPGSDGASVRISPVVDPCESMREQDIEARKLADFAADAYNETSHGDCDGLCADPSKHLPGERIAGPGGQYPSEDVYDSKGRVIQSLKEMGAKFEDGSGFKASLYKTSSGNYVLAFAGTDGLLNVQDEWTNVVQGMIGVPPSQYNDAIILTSEVKYWATLQGKTLELTGHSLGGGLAATAAMVNGLSATTFNAARTSKGSMDPSTYGIPESATANVDNYEVEGEFLAPLQDLFGGSQTGTPIGRQHSISVPASPSDNPQGFWKKSWNWLTEPEKRLYDSLVNLGTHHKVENVKKALDQKIAQGPIC